MYELDKEDYYKQIKTDNAFSSNCVEYESNGDKYRSPLIEEYVDKIRSYFSDMINDHYQVLMIIYHKGFIMINVQIVSLALITYQLKIIN